MNFIRRKLSNGSKYVQTKFEIISTTNLLQRSSKMHRYGQNANFLKKSKNITNGYFEVYFKVGEFFFLGAF